MGKQKKSAKGFGCAMLFFLPFGLVGIGMGGWSYYQAFEWLSMKSWTETPATILTLKLNESRGGKNGDSKTYRIEGTFQYSVNEQNYTSDRISVYTANDNIGSFHQDAYARFKPLLNVPDGAVCYVNPNDVENAVLIRDARWAMFAFYSIFATLFGSIGVLGIPILKGHWREAAEADSQMSIYPDEPWKWHPRWSSGQVRSNQNESVKNWTRSSIWWTIATAPTCFFSTMALFGGDFWALVGLIPVGCTALIVKGLLRRKRLLAEYGAAHLQCKELPLRPGTQTTIAAVFPAGELPLQPVVAEITCQKKTYASNNKSKTKTVYENNQEIDLDECRIINGGLVIAVPVEIPADGHSTTPTSDDVNWKLKLAIPTRSGSMNIEFRLPIF